MKTFVCVTLESSESQCFFKMDLVGRLCLSLSSFLCRAVSSSLNSVPLFCRSLSAELLELLLLTLRARPLLSPLTDPWPQLFPLDLDLLRERLLLHPPRLTRLRSGL